MMNLLASITGLLGSVETTQPKAPSAGAADGFSSLLAIGMDKDTGENLADSGQEESAPLRRPEARQETPVAVEVQAPLIPAPRHAPEKTEPDILPAQNDNTPPASPSLEAAPAEKESPAPETGDAPVATLTPQERDVRGKLEKQLGATADILQSIIQLLSGAPADAAATPVADTPGLSLLKDIAALLPQIQQALQPDAPAEVTATLPQLTDMLQKNLTQLSQLLAPAPGDSAPISLASLMPASAPMDEAQLQALTAQLKGNIGQVREQLQQISSANETAFAAVQEQAQTSSPDIAQVFKNILASNGIVIKDVVKEEANAQAAVAASASPVMTVSATQVNAVVAADAAMMNSGGDTNQGNGNSQQQGATPAGALSASSQASAAKSDANFAKALSQASTPVLQQVAFQIKTAVADGSSKIHIQLHPAELGKLEIKINLGADGKAGVMVTADNKDTLALLQRDSAGLARALADAGLQTQSGSLSFNLRGGQQEGQGGNQHAAGTYQKLQPEEESDVAGNLITRSYVVNLADGLDIHI